MSIDVLTFGCRLNIVESEAMRRAAEAAGHHDLVIVNSCAVTAEAVRQGRQAIRRAKRARPDVRVLATGCAAETDAAGFRAMPEVDGLLPNRTKTSPSMWQDLAGGGRPSFADGTRPAFPSASHTRGFVEVQNGCDHRCTFCIIPYGRGPSRSVPTAAVIARVRAEVEAGAREVVLTGVDVTAYTDAGVTLGTLVRQILRQVPDLPRLRLSSLDCIEIDPELVACLAEEPRLMPHLHLSIQSGSDLILKRMARRHRRADIDALCRALRAARPDIVFGADFIAGFPTETEAQFDETLALVEQCGISYVHAFPFSPRPGTPAARMPPVTGEVVRSRAARLRTLGDAQLHRHLDARIGRRLTVLSERNGVGHAEDFTRVVLPDNTPPGVIGSFEAVSHDGRSVVSSTSA